MGLLAKTFLVLCALLYTIGVLKLLVNRKINEKNTITWLAAVFVVLILAALPKLLDKAATLIGIDYPPSLLFLSTSLVLLYTVLRQAVQLSVLDDRVRELAQLQALQTHQNMREAEE